MELEERPGVSTEFQLSVSCFWSPPGPGVRSEVSMSERVRGLWGDDLGHGR